MGIESYWPMSIDAGPQKSGSNGELWPEDF